MSKIQVISYCNDCKHFDNRHWGYNHTCEKLKRQLWKYKKESRLKDDMTYLIPKDCPLKDYKKYKNKGETK